MDEGKIYWKDMMDHLRLSLETLPPSSCPYHSNKISVCPERSFDIYLLYILCLIHQKSTACGGRKEHTLCPIAINIDSQAISGGLVNMQWETTGEFCLAT